MANTVESFRVFNETYSEIAVEIATLLNQDVKIEDVIPSASSSGPD